MQPELDKFKGIAGEFKDQEFNANLEVAKGEITECQHYRNVEKLLFPRCAN